LKFGSVRRGRERSSGCWIEERRDLSRMATKGMRGGMSMGETGFSDQGLPASFGNYRPPQTFDEDAEARPPPSFAQSRNMPQFPSREPDMPQSRLSGAPGKSMSQSNSAFQEAELPQSMAQGQRPKDFLFKALLDSQGGTDEVASFAMPVVRERATGVTGDQVPVTAAQQQQKADADIGAYEGEMVGGQREGHGMCKYRNGSMYEGDWVQGKRHGRGVMHFVSGAEYDGEWSDNERSGHGVMKYKDSSCYEGQWLRDLKHGYGCYQFASGAVYTGQWFEGKLHGQGTYTYADGQQFTGEFDRNHKSGFGSHRYTSDDQWDGIWVSDEPHGSGLYTFAGSGEKVESQFVVAGDPPPMPGRTGNTVKVLRKEDKLKIISDGEVSLSPITRFLANQRERVFTSTCTHPNFPTSA
jgi:hypothetical protein